MATDGCVVNTLASDALSEVNRHLKRAYWPFAWDTRIDSLATGGAGSHGGFRCARAVALSVQKVLIDLLY